MGKQSPLATTAKIFASTMTSPVPKVVNRNSLSRKYKDAPAAPQGKTQTTYINIIHGFTITILIIPTKDLS